MNWQETTGQHFHFVYCGPCGVSETDMTTPLVFLKLFADDEVFDMMVAETNLNAPHVLESVACSADWRINKWKDVSRGEMEIFKVHWATHMDGHGWHAFHGQLLEDVYAEQKCCYSSCYAMKQVPIHS